MMTSLRSRLILLLSVLIALIALVQGGLAYREALQQADDVFDYHLQQMANSLQPGIRAEGPESPDAMPAEGFDFIVQVWSQDGARIYRSREIATLPDHAVLGFSDAPKGRDGQWRVYSIQTPTQTIQVVQDMAVRNRMARDMALHAVWPLLLFAPLSMLLAGWVVSRSLRPVAQVKAIAAQRSHQDLSPLPEAGLPDEVLPLVQEINSLFARVQTSIDGQRQFVANAAHELRTPLTALKLQAQGLLRARDETQREQGLHRLQEGIDRASHLVGQLLALARQEAQPGAVLARQPADLAELARNEVTRAAELAAERRIDLGLNAPEPAVGTVDADGMRTVLSNLIENAIKYTPEGGQVDVDVQAQTGGVGIEVADSGPGIAPELQPRVFDRFYRAPGVEAAGAGLGLAIVHAIVEQHHGTIELGRSRLGGLSVRVWLPAAAANVVAKPDTHQSTSSSTPPKAAGKPL